MFTVADAPENLNAAQKRAWVRVANSAAKNGKDDDGAKGVADKAVTATEAVVMMEVGRILSRKHEDAIRNSVSNLVTILNKLAKGQDVEDQEIDDATGEKAEEAWKVLEEALSFYERQDLIGRALRQEHKGAWAQDYFDDYVVYENDGKLFKADYTIEKGKVTFGESTEVRKSTTYIAVGESEVDRVVSDILEGEPNIVEDVVPLVEAVLRKDGSVPIKIISPGWGSSGYYSEKMLKRDGPKVFKKGTHMYWDHPSKSEESDRPERSLRDLSAVLLSDAVYKEQGPSGPGLYSDAQVRKAYRDDVEELAPHIGTSIRAFGNSKHGEAEGRKGPIIENLVSAASVDFVTKPGRGGEIVQMFEAARGKNVGEAPAERKESAEANDVSQEELQEAQRQLEESKRETARALEALAIRDASDVAAGLLKGSTLHDAAKERLLGEVTKNPPIKEGALDKEKFEEAVKASIKAEEAYIAKLTGRAGVHGMGDSGDPVIAEADLKKYDEQLTSAFGMIGLNESRAKNAVAGRVS